MKQIVVLVPGVGEYILDGTLVLCPRCGANAEQFVIQRTAIDGSFRWADCQGCRKSFKLWAGGLKGVRVLQYQTNPQN